MPSPLLPEMTLRCDADVPPIVVLVLPLPTRMPTPEFATAAVPAALTPIRLPRTIVPVLVPLVPSVMPLRSLPEIRLSRTWLPLLSLSTKTPSSVLPRSSVPVASVPM